MIRLLVCDDSTEARVALRTMLGEHGSIEVVDEARNGQEAIARAVELTPDVVLMDIAMPVLDGIAATKEIRHVLPRTRVVAYSGLSDDETVKAMLEAGASAYCVKGVPLSELEHAIAGAPPTLTYAQAERDALTGLPNRRAFEQRLAAVLPGALQVGLALLDVDDFGKIGEDEGPQAGDDILRQVAHVLQRNVRASEDVYRIGADEFALVIAGEPETAAFVSDRIRTALEQHRRERRLPTISAGVARFPVDGRTKQELVASAEAALYAAKRAGKNRVVVFGADPQARPSADGARPATRDPSSRILVVDDDAPLRTLLRTTLEAIDIEVDEAESADRARATIGSRRPDVVVLDVGLPGLDGLAFCRELKAEPRTADVPVILLTGAELGAKEAARSSGADGFLRKPFSPLELLAVVEQLLHGLYEGSFRERASRRPEEQVLLYAEDLRRLLELERGQRALVQRAYRQTVGALAAALESKDIGTGHHSQRVQRYAAELARALAPSLLDDPSLEYGFLLHDIGKIAIPDQILQKPDPLTAGERRILETHTVLGEQMLGGVDLLQGEGLRVVRSHHERWDGAGYPDALGGEEIPLSARVFAVADALDAMTSNRAYRPAMCWDEAAFEIRAEARLHFDPTVVDAFREREPTLRRIYYELAQA